MSYSVKLEKLAKQKEESRQIVKRILEFGVSEDQKYDIIFEICLTLENNKAMKEINEILKKFREKINKDEETDNNDNKVEKPKLII